MAQDKKITMDILTIGSKTDASWSQAYAEAYQYLMKKYPDVIFKFSDMNPYAEFPSILEATAQMGVNIIYCESAWVEAVQKVAPRYPKTWFVMPGAMTAQLEGIKSDNVMDVHQKWEEGGFLCGVAAGLMTKTNKLGYVAGNDYPNVIRVGVGFREGAKSVNPKINLLTVYTGDWVDVQKGYEAAKSLIELGVDVIIHHNDNAGKGVFKAAKDYKGRKTYLVGYVRDQSEFAPDAMITSYFFDHSRLAETVLLDYKAGRLKKEARGFGIREGWPPIAPVRNVTPKVEAKVKEVMESIKQGKTKVPLVTDPKALTGTRSH
jgi:basic membrane lipoprotein Med (substrate-binding protein (PBP1-ABC) superfamily)